MIAWGIVSIWDADDDPAEPSGSTQQAMDVEKVVPVPAPTSPAPKVVPKRDVADDTKLVEALRFADARNGRAWIARRCAGDENADEIDAVAVQLFARFSAFRVYRRHDLEEWRKYVHRQKRCDFDSGSPYPRGIDSLERVAARGMGKDDWISLSRNPR